MAERFAFLTLLGLSGFLRVDAFYNSSLSPFSDNITTVYPTSTEELVSALAGTETCKVVLTKIFDFTYTQDWSTADGCYHVASPIYCLVQGQQKLNVSSQCDGLTEANVTYSLAGVSGVIVGSNKLIVGNGFAGLKGRGLRLFGSSNVEIRNISITDINAHVIWGGDGIDLVSTTNVLIDGVYVKNVGRQMVVAHYSGNTGVTMSNSVFNGYSPNSANCLGNHYWLWLFIGQGDQITLQNNVVFGTAGRGPKVLAASSQQSMIHIIQNTFNDVVDSGLLDVGDTKSVVLMEGNVFVNVTYVVKENLAYLYMPSNSTDAAACTSYLGRECLVNTFVNSEGISVTNSEQVLIDFANIYTSVASPIDMSASVTDLTRIPPYVMQYIK